MSEFNYKVKVFYEDTDAGGVVYYANYLKFFERARTEAIAEIGLSNNNWGHLVLVFDGTDLMQTGKAIEIISITMFTYLTLSISISILMN